MESFGAYLKSLREEKGLSLEEIAESTKIAVSNLDFLEKDRFDLLPPRVFVKGFVRSYVQELGLNPEEVLKKFEEFTRQGELDDYEAEMPMFNEVPSTSRSFITSRWFTWLLTAAGVLAISVLLLTGVSRLLSWVGDFRSTGPTVTTVRPANQGEDSADTQPSRDVGKTTFSEPPRKQAGKKVLEIKALSNTWIRVEPDNGPAEELVMGQGESKVFMANETFQIQTGNAGGIRLRFDGRELGLLGRENQSLALTLP
jgi:cytoskeletal protein RodZ